MKIKEVLLNFIFSSYLYRIYKHSIKPNLFLRRKLAKQLILKSNYEQPKIKFPKKIFIPLIETSHPIKFLIMIIAKTLSLRGHEILILECGSALPSCEIKSIRHTKRNPCLSCKSGSKTLKLFGLTTFKIRDFLNEKELLDLEEKSKAMSHNFNKYISYRGVYLKSIIDDSVTRYFYGAVPFDDINEIRFRRFQSLWTALISIEIAHKVNKDWSPDIIFGAMTVYSDFSPYYRYFENINTQISTIFFSQMDFKKLYMDLEELIISRRRYKAWLEIRKFKYLSTQEDKLLEKFIEKRFAGNADIFNSLAFFKEEKDLKPQINLDLNKKNVLLVPNIFWDVGLQDTHTIFNDIIDWVMHTTKTLAGNENIDLYIKPHPGEKYDSTPSSKGIEDFINEWFESLPKNFKFIRPEDKLKIYDMLKEFDYVITYNGTIGLEAMLLGVPVVTAGKGPYRNLNLSNDPNTIEEYNQMISNKVDLLNPNSDAVRSFAYFYFIKSLIPFDDVIQQVYASEFNGYEFQSLDDLLDGSKKNLEHIVNCIVDKEQFLPEAWT